MILNLILLVLVLASGFWVSRMGKPYNGILFNIHKLLALGAVVVVVIQLVAVLRQAAPPALTIALLVVAAICVVTLFASGALMSAGKLDYGLMRAVHRIAPAGLLVSLALVLYGL